MQIVQLKRLVQSIVSLCKINTNPPEGQIKRISIIQNYFIVSSLPLLGDYLLAIIANAVFFHSD